MTTEVIYGDILNSNVLFMGDSGKKIKYSVKEYIRELVEMGHKVFLLDSFWSKERYARFQTSRFRREIERRYHIKLSVEEFLQSDNVYDYMDEKGVNIIKVKSIMGYMSAAELFPVILSKINQDLTNQRVHILINDFVLDNINELEFLDLYMGINKENIKFFAFSEKNDLPKGIKSIIDCNFEVN